MNECFLTPRMEFLPLSPVDILCSSVGGGGGGGFVPTPTTTAPLTSSAPATSSGFDGDRYLDDIF